MVSESFGVAGTGSAAPPRSTLLTFLIADVRGYTRFTVEHGDEAAARLAGIFARIARDVARPHGGEVIELRGDEALAVFDSARNALWTAVALQERFAQQMALDPALPLTVGMGLDAGEAVPVAGGYRGGALNRAARLCSLAVPGEVLCSQEVSHLAGRTVGITVRDRGTVTLKGLPEPVPVLQAFAADQVPAGALPPLQQQPAPLPSGIVSFLYTDIAGSTRLWQEYPEHMPSALDRHDALIKQAVEEAGGVVFRRMGDASCAAFSSPSSALAAALAAQHVLFQEPWEVGPMRE